MNSAQHLSNGRTVIEVDGERHFAFQRAFAHIAKELISDKLQLAWMDGNDRRRMGSFSFFNYRADKAAVGHVKSANRVTVFTSRCQHLFH